ncbi:MAG: hypothetical protein V1670_02835 [Candidatus Omnitrophota bacterium]
MCKISVRVVLISLLLFVLFINFAWCDNEAQSFISVEKARSIFSSDADMRILANKWEEGCTLSAREFPDPNSPYYVFYLKQGEWVPKNEELKIKMDAYTGQILLTEDLRREIAAIKEAVSSFMQEKSVNVTLDRLMGRRKRGRCLGKVDTIKDLKTLQDFSVLFLQTLDKSTPDIQAGGGRISNFLATHRAELDRAKKAIPKSLELITGDYHTYYVYDPEGLRKDMLPLIKDYDALVKGGGVNPLGRVGEISLVPIFIPLLEDISLNQDTVKTLGNLRDVTAVKPLIKLFESKQYSYLETSIIHNLGQIGGEQAITFLIELFNKNFTKDVRWPEFEPPWSYAGADAAVALAKIGKDAIPYLLESLKAKDYLTRLYSVYGLNLIKDQSSLNSLKDALVKEDNPTVKIYIEKAIAEIEGRIFTAPAANLEVRVESSKQKYKLKEEINLFLCIENKDSVPVIINTAAIYEGIFSITGPDGEPLYGQLEFSRRTDFPAQDSLITLNPGQTHKAGSFSIQEDYSFTAPGRYQISGIYENRFNAIEFGVYAWVGKVESQAITIEVK